MRMPGAFMSMITTLMPRCFGASGSVRTKQKQWSAWCAPDVQIFWPVTTKWSSCTSARVERPARSLPAPGSLIPRHQAISARSVGSRYFCFRSSLP